MDSVDPQMDYGGGGNLRVKERKAYRMGSG